MTTHLVIADVDTIVALEQSDPLIWECYHADRRCDCPMTNKLTGDTWLFRTPDDDTLALTCDFVYPASVMGAIAGSRALRHHRAGDRQRRILPLIAACDLLGIEEL